VQNIRELWPGHRVGDLHVVKAESIRLPEADDEDPLSVLRDPRFGIDDFPPDLVPQLIRENVVDNAERSTLIVVEQVLYVLEYKGLRLVMADYASYLVKQRPLGLAGKPVWAVESVLFRHPGNRKWLTGESRQENIMIRNRPGLDASNVTGDHVRIVGKVGPVGLLRIPIPFAGEDTLSPDLLKPSPQAADAGKKINESKSEGSLGWFVVL
jgi:hypothetical protein